MTCLSFDNRASAIRADVYRTEAAHVQRSCATGPPPGVQPRWLSKAILRLEPNRRARPVSGPPNRRQSHRTSTSIQTSRWSELGNGNNPTSGNSGSVLSGQKAPASVIFMFLRGST